MQTTLNEIYASALKFLEPQTSQETYKTIVDEIMHLVNAQYGSILLEQNGQLQRQYASSPEIYRFSTRKRGNSYKVFQKNKARILDISESTVPHPELKNKGLSSTLISPLSYQEKAIGVMTMFATNGRVFLQEDLEIIRFFSPLATLAIKKAQAFEQINEALQKRDLFISMASHELKTPLTSVYAYLQLMHFKMLKGETFDPEWIQRIMNEVEHLTKLVNELLQINQVRTGILRFHKKNCSVLEITDRAVKNFDFSHPDYHIQLQNRTNGAGDIVFADYDKLLQVFMNILNNAAKFSQKELPITLLVKSDEKHVAVVVKDRGKGIAKDDLPNIFEGYYKGSNSPHEGMGLGLFLAKQIVDAHSGTILVQSKVGQGTKVSIFLPLVT